MASSLEATSASNAITAVQQEQIRLEEWYPELAATYARDEPMDAFTSAQ